MTPRAPDVKRKAVPLRLSTVNLQRALHELGQSERESKSRSGYCIETGVETVSFLSTEKAEGLVLHHLALVCDQWSMPPGLMGPHPLDLLL